MAPAPPSQQHGRGRSLCAVLVASAVAGALSRDFGIGTSLPPDPRETLLGPDAQWGLDAWLGDLVIELPSGTALAGGAFTVDTFRCWDLSVQALDHSDLSAGTALKYDLRLMGLGARCEVHGMMESDFGSGTVNVSMALSDAQLDTSVEVQPFIPASMPAVALPFGNMSFPNCTANLAASTVSIGGTFPLLGLAPTTNEARAEMLCQMLPGVLAEKGSAAMKKAAGLSPLLLRPPTALPEPEMLRPSIDWETYPPTVVLQNLIKERFGLWSHRLVQILDMNSFNISLMKTERVSLHLRQMRLVGEGADDRPGMAVIGEKKTLGMDVDMNNLTVEAVLLLEVTLPGQQALNEVVTVNVGLNTASVRMRALFDESRLDNIDFDKASESARCLIDCTDGITDPQRKSLAVTDAEVGLRPVLHVDAPGKLEADVAGLINSVFGSMLEDSAYMEGVGLTMNGGLGMYRGPLNTQLWNRIEKLPPCSEPGMLLGLSRAAVEALPFVSLALFVLGLVGGAVAHCAARRRRSAREATGAAASDSARFFGDHSLAREPVVPAALAVFYPFAVLSVMFLYWFADFALGATVSVVMEANGKETTIGPVFSFSLLSTIVDSARSGSWVLSIITLALSGIWPHVKLFMLLFTWVVPPRGMSIKARERILGFLDTWGKYGFLESWFLIHSMSAFSIEWESIGTNSSMKLETTPVVAFYTYFAATILAIFLGNVASEFNAAASASTTSTACGSQCCRPRPPAQQGGLAAVADGGRGGEAARGDDGTESVADSDASSTISTTRREDDERRPLSALVPRTVRLSVGCALSASLVLGVFSAILESFEFTMSGFFVDFLLGHPIDKQYSLLTVGDAVSAGRLDNKGLVMLEFSFFLFSFVIPFALIITLAVLWFYPMPARWQRACLRTGHLLDSWACLDVAVLVTLVAIFQYGMMAKFLIYQGSFATPCGMIRDLTEEACLDIEMRAKPGIAAVVLAGLAFLVVPKVAMRQAEAALEGSEGRKKSSESPANPAQEAAEVS